jgi:hypothetical protein
MPISCGQGLCLRSRLADHLDQPPCVPNQLSELAAHGDRLAGKLAVLQGIAISNRRTAPSSMHSAHTKAPNGRRPAWLPTALRPRFASWREMYRQLHGVDLDLFAHPLPLPSMLPTIACPPSLTVTCFTRTFCSPPVRYRLSASTCAAKVRASLLKARSASFRRPRAAWCGAADSSIQIQRPFTFRF